MNVKQHNSIFQRIKENPFVRTIWVIFFYSFLSITIHLINLNFTNNEFTPLNYAFTDIVVILFFVKYHRFVLSHFKRLKSDIKENYKSLLYIFCLGTLGTLLLTYVYTNIFHIYSANELDVEELIKGSALQMIPVSLLLAPISEELTYRAILTDLKKHRFACTIISSILFGLAHVLSANNLFIGLIYLIPYSMIGFTFAFGALKTNNSLVSMLMHIAYNLINFVILLCI